MTRVFEWYDEKRGGNCRMTTDFADEKRAWSVALSECGWENRTSLRTVDEKGCTLVNWWEAVRHIGVWKQK